MRALVFNNMVVQITDADFPVNPNLIWMDAPEGCEVGWQLVGGVLQAPPIEPLNPEKQIELYTDALKGLFNAKAKEKNYDDEISIVSYAQSSNEEWQLEAQQYIAWRDACWLYAIAIKTQIENDEISAPSVDDFINEAPQLVWS